MVGELGRFDMISSRELNTVILNALLPNGENKTRIGRLLTEDEEDTTIDPIMAVNVVRTNEESTNPAPSDIVYEWKVTEIKSYKLTFQIDFESPLGISNS